MLKEDFPAAPLLPTALVDHGQTVEIDGQPLRVHEFGPGEAASMTGLKLGGGDMITADIFANQMTPFVIEGRMLRWIDQLASFGAALPDITRVFPGHGNPAGAARLVEAQSAYLVGFRDLVRDAADAQAVSTSEPAITSLPRSSAGIPVICQWLKCRACSL